MPRADDNEFKLTNTQKTIITLGAIGSILLGVIVSVANWNGVEKAHAVERLIASGAQPLDAGCAVWDSYNSSRFMDKSDHALVSARREDAHLACRLDYPVDRE